MTIKRLDPNKVTTPKSQPDLNLTIRDGWNFGLGFFIAAFIFTFVIIPVLSCGALVTLSMFGAMLGDLLQ